MASTSLAESTSLRRLAAEAREWLFEAAAPRWRATLGSEPPLFPERQSICAEREACPHRLFVQARHIFSYCELGRHGWEGPWREMVGANVDFLLARGRRADGFYIHKFEPDGAVHDPRADLYDQAFMLLAFAHAGRALRRPDLFACAEALGDALERTWRLPHGGYYEGEIAACPPYRQNPHMHLLESFIALHVASGASRWREAAEQIAKLCSSRFLDKEAGALLEYFDADLRPLDGDEGRIVEPGHCFEWAWLFEILAEWGAPGAVAASDRLTAFGRRHGLDAGRGVAVNEVRTDGSVRNAHARLWPQTERLKLALARHRRTGDPAESDEAAAAYAGLRKYFDTPSRGVWRDKLGPDNAWLDEPSPGSSLYHITCAFSELIDTAEATEIGVCNRGSTRKPSGRPRLTRAGD